MDSKLEPELRRRGLKGDLKACAADGCGKYKTCSKCKGGAVPMRLVQYQCGIVQLGAPRERRGLRNGWWPLSALIFVGQLFSGRLVVSKVNIPL